MRAIFILGPAFAHGYFAVPLHFTKPRPQQRPEAGQEEEEEGGPLQDPRIVCRYLSLATVIGFSVLVLFVVMRGTWGEGATTDFTRLSAF